MLHKNEKEKINQAMIVLEAICADMEDSDTYDARAIELMQIALSLFEEQLEDDISYADVQQEDWNSKAQEDNRNTDVGPFEYNDYKFLDNRIASKNSDSDDTSYIPTDDDFRKWFIL